MKIKTHSEIIDKWPSIEAFAAAIGENYPKVYAWYCNNKIPSKYWSIVINEALKQGFSLTAKTLLDTQ